MATSVHSNSNDISNDELFARNLQKEEYNRIKEQMRKNRKEKLRNEIRLLNLDTIIPEAETNNQSSPSEENDIIIIDDDNDQNILNQTIENNTNDIDMEISNENDTNMDEIIARQLQDEFDKELASTMNRHSSSRNSAPNRTENNTLPGTSARDQSNLRTQQNQTNLRRRNETTNRIPNSFETDILFNMARDSNSSTSSRNSNPTNLLELLSNRYNNSNNGTVNVNRTARSNQSDPATSLVAAFNFLHNRDFMSEFLSDDPDFIDPIETSAEPVRRSVRISNTNNNNNVNTNYNQFTGRPATRNANNRPSGQLPIRRARPTFFGNMFQLSTNDRDFTSDDYESLLRLDERNSVKKGLTKSEIDLLPTFEFKGNNEGADENTCSICYDEYAKKDMLTALTCSHKFHKKCIKTWLQQSRMCPLCKKDAVNGN